MRVVLTLIGALVANLFKSPHRLEVENLFLRHQLSIALRRAPHRVHLRGCDRALLVWLTWLWPGLLGLSRVVQPETILRWHRAGLRAVHDKIGATALFGIRHICAQMADASAMTNRFASMLGVVPIRNTVGTIFWLFSVAGGEGH